MHSKDFDFLAIVLEELDKAGEAKSKEWMLETLGGPSFRVVKQKMKEQLPAHYPFWLKFLLNFFLRFKYRREQRVIEKRFRNLFQHAKTSAYIEEQSKTTYQITDKGKQWLELEYAPERGRIDSSDVQAVYDAVKICKALQQASQLPEPTLMEKALPASPIPEKAGKMLRAMLIAHNESIPEAFQRAISFAQEKGWVQYENQHWSLTPHGKEEGLTFNEHLANPQ